MRRNGAMLVGACSGVLQTERVRLGSRAGPTDKALGGGQVSTPHKALIALSLAHTVPIIHSS